MKQITSDKDFVSIIGIYDPKILFYKYLVNKDIKSVLTNEEKNLRKYNKFVVKTCLRNHMKEKEIQLNKLQKYMTEKERDIAITEFEIKFLRGDYVSNPEMYLNV